MNKQEIENAIEIITIINEHIDFECDLNQSFRECFPTIISALEQQLNGGWIPVSSGNLPKCEERVFICADRKCYGGKVMQIRTTGMYEDGTMHTEDSSYVWEDHDFEYCEETDDYIIPEGWFEQNMYCEEYGIIDDVVTHWMPLPEYPTGEVSK